MLQHIIVHMYIVTGLHDDIRYLHMSRCTPSEMQQPAMMAYGTLILQECIRKSQPAAGRQHQLSYRSLQVPARSQPTLPMLSMKAMLAGSSTRLAGPSSTVKTLLR